AVTSSPAAEGACSGAAGVFDGDGRADLAVAAPYATVGGHARAGAVTLLYGSGRRAELSQDSPGVPGEAEPGDSFGSALATGDFDGDGCADLAVGASEEFHGRPVAGADGHGVVQLFTGSPTGLRPGPALRAPKAASDRYGAALAAGNLDRDRADELAIGAPTHGSGGAVFLYGMRGLTRLTQATGWIGQQGRVTDQWGAALATGDFDGDGRAELAVGAPADSLTHDGQGSVTIVSGRRALLLTQDSRALKGSAEKWDAFGAALTTGDFDADGRADLAVGSPGEGLTANQRALDYGDGMVHVLYGTRSGLAAGRREAWTQNALDGKPRYFDRFGTSLAAGDLNGDGDDELAVGVPGESAVQVLAGTRSGGLTRRGNLLLKGPGADFGSALTVTRLSGRGYRALGLARPLASLVVAAPARGTVSVLPGIRRPGPYAGLRPGAPRKLAGGPGLFGYTFG
ncbi:FG-GAP repeat protein, partial [Nonomuraea sp. NPDC050310]|uniref:FG-GAP and VCBS repeat-containing protein n=1 Tax=Nonomuraea sp. NPDC050310 TaxID=3154935 RepID=UPI00340E994F